MKDAETKKQRIGEIERQTDRETKKARDGVKRDREMEKEIDVVKKRQRRGKIERQRNKETEKWRYRETDGQMDGQRN